MTKFNPLVSVVIITYNSEETIIETLDSIKGQSYKNIELIISDDCSNDSTIVLIDKWLSNNSSHFVKAQLLRSTINTGVAPNLNRGIKATKGTWIKSLAGDDTLEPFAIEEYVKFVEQNYCNICIAKMKTFGPDLYANKINSDYLERIYNDLRLPTRMMQYRAALERHIMPGPGIFYKKSFFIEIGEFNEKYPLAEEYDFQLRVLDKTKFYFIDKYLINWRIRPNSLCHSVEDTFLKNLKDSFYEVRLPRMLKERMFLRAWHHIILNFIYKKNQNNFFIKHLIWISPYQWVSYIKQKFN